MSEDTQANLAVGPGAGRGDRPSSNPDLTLFSQFAGGGDPMLNDLLTDMALEDNRAGLDLAEAVRKDEPDLQVTCTRGQGREITERRAGPAGSGCTFLPKPHRPQALAHAVRDLLDSTL